ncbi:MAG: methyltransferase domain-containing protein [Chloroflexota bacterium]
MGVQKELVAGLYDRTSASYDQVGPKTVSRFGERLVELLDLPAGAHVLDVGVGRGANLFPAAKRVGTHGRVVGIDISRGMLDEVAADIQKQGLLQAEVMQMDGEQLNFADGSFDYLLCGYTIFWFGDLVQALRGFRRVLKDDGKLGISMYGGGDPRWDWYGQLIQTYDERYVRFKSFGGNGVNANPEMLRNVLQEAGFGDVHMVVEPSEIVYTSAEEWWEEKWTHGSRAPLEQMTAEVRVQFKQEALAQLAEMEENGVYRMIWQTCFATASK